MVTVIEGRKPCPECGAKTERLEPYDGSPATLRCTECEWQIKIAPAPSPEMVERILSEPRGEPYKPKPENAGKITWRDE